MSPVVPVVVMVPPARMVTLRPIAPVERTVMSPSPVVAKSGASMLTPEPVKLISPPVVIVMLPVPTAETAAATMMALSASDRCRWILRWCC